MKKETIKYIIQLIVAVLTAIGSTLSVTTAASGVRKQCFHTATLCDSPHGRGWGWVLNRSELFSTVLNPLASPPLGGGG